MFNEPSRPKDPESKQGKKPHISDDTLRRATAVNILCLLLILLVGSIWSIVQKRKQAQQPEAQEQVIEERAPEAVIQTDKSNQRRGNQARRPRKAKPNKNDRKPRLATGSGVDLPY